jgi:hypothetical protein
LTLLSARWGARSPTSSTRFVSAPAGVELVRGELRLDLLGI